MNLYKAEVWLGGPIEGIIPLLQPIAHALLQAREEVNKMLEGFSEEKLWIKPFELASPGFHLQHLTGVLDRLFTYARAEDLSQAQLNALQSEGEVDTMIWGKVLVAAFNQQVDVALEQLKHVADAELTEARGVGRAKVPSTVIGLYVHAAEHTMRHVGQLLVTIRCESERELSPTTLLVT